MYYIENRFKVVNRKRKLKKFRLRVNKDEITLLTCIGVSCLHFFVYDGITVEFKCLTFIVTSGNIWSIT